MSAKFHYINHACFVIAKNDSAIIFDPYLDGNPEGLTADDIKVDYIFISHAHFDHLGSAFEIAKKCDATIISTAEIAGYLGCPQATVRSRLSRARKTLKHKLGGDF